MALYTPSLGDAPDGLCACGQPASHEVETGWHNGPSSHQSGGQYDEMCAACYAATDEAKHHQREAAIRAACARLGIDLTGRMTPVVEAGAYARHPRADEIIAAIEADR